MTKQIEPRETELVMLAEAAQVLEQFEYQRQADAVLDGVCELDRLRTAIVTLRAEVARLTSNWEFAMKDRDAARAAHEEARHQASLFKMNELEALEQRDHQKQMNGTILRSCSAERRRAEKAEARAELLTQACIAAELAVVGAGPETIMARAKEYQAQWREQGDEVDRLQARVAELEAALAPTGRKIQESVSAMQMATSDAAVAERRIDELTALLRDTHRHLSEAYWDAAVGAEAYPPAVELQLRRVDQALTAPAGRVEKPNLPEPARLVEGQPVMMRAIDTAEPEEVGSNPTEALKVNDLGTSQNCPESPAKAEVERTDSLPATVFVNQAPRVQTGTSYDAIPDGFEKELRSLLNSRCLDNFVETPDFMVAKAVAQFIAILRDVVLERERWFGRTASPIDGHPIDVITDEEAKCSTCGKAENSICSNSFHITDEEGAGP